MKTKKIPQRMCVVTRNVCDKKDLLRIVKTKEDLVFVDTTGKANGKGAYITKDIDVLNKAIKDKTLDRVFGINISDDVYEEIKKNI